MAGPKYFSPKREVRDKDRDFDEGDVYAPFEEALMSVLYAMVKQNDTHRRMSAIGLIIDFALMLDFAFSPTVNWGETVSKPLRYFASFFSMPAWEWGVAGYSTAFIVICLALVLSIVDMAYVGTLFVRRQFKRLWPIKLLRVMVGLLVTIAYIPFLKILTAGLNCSLLSTLFSSNSSDPGPVNAYDIVYYLNGPQCPTGAFPTVMRILAAFFSLIFIFFSLGMTLVYYDPNPLSESPFCKPSGRLDVFYVGAKSLLVVIVQVLPDASLLHSGVLLFITVFMLISTIKTQPFFRLDMNRRKSILFSVMSLAALLSVALAGAAYSKLSESGLRWIGEAAAVGFVALAVPVALKFARVQHNQLVLSQAVTFPSLDHDLRMQSSAPVNLVALACRRAAAGEGEVLPGVLQRVPETIDRGLPPAQSRSMLTTYIRRLRRTRRTEREAEYPAKAARALRFSSPKKVEVAQRFIHRYPNSQHYLALADAVWQAGLRKWPDSPYLRVNYAVFLTTYCMDADHATAQTDHARHMRPPIDVRFLLYTNDREREQTASALGDTGGTMNVMAYVEFQKNYRTAKKFDWVARKLHLRFWSILVAGSRGRAPRLSRLSDALNKIEHAELKGSTAYERLVQKFPNSAVLLAAYADYLDDVKRQPAQARLYRDRLDRMMRIRAEQDAERERTDAVTAAAQGTVTLAEAARRATRAGDVLDNVQESYSDESEHTSVAESDVTEVFEVSSGEAEMLGLSSGYSDVESSAGERTEGSGAFTDLEEEEARVEAKEVRKKDEDGVLSLVAQQSLKKASRALSVHWLVLFVFILFVSVTSVGTYTIAGVQLKYADLLVTRGEMGFGIQKTALHLSVLSGLRGAGASTAFDEAGALALEAIESAGKCAAASRHSVASSFNILSAGTVGAPLGSTHVAFLNTYSVRYPVAATLTAGSTTPGDVVFTQFPASRGLPAGVVTSAALSDALMAAASPAGTGQSGIYAPYCASCHSGDSADTSAASFYLDSLHPALLAAYSFAEDTALLTLTDYDESLSLRLIILLALLPLAGVVVLVYLYLISAAKSHALIERNVALNIFLKIPHQAVRDIADRVSSEAAGSEEEKKRRPLRQITRKKRGAAPEISLAESAAALVSRSGARAHTEETAPEAIDFSRFEESTEDSYYDNDGYYEYSDDFIEGPNELVDTDAAASQRRAIMRSAGSEKLPGARGRIGGAPIRRSIDGSVVPAALAAVNRAASAFREASSIATAPTAEVPPSPYILSDSDAGSVVSFASSVARPVIGGRSTADEWTRFAETDHAPTRTQPRRRRNDANDYNVAIPTSEPEEDVLALEIDKMRARLTLWRVIGRFALGLTFAGVAALVVIVLVVSGGGQITHLQSLAATIGAVAPVVTSVVPMHRDAVLYALSGDPAHLSRFADEYAEQKVTDAIHRVSGLGAIDDNLDDLLTLFEEASKETLYHCAVGVRISASVFGPDSHVLEPLNGLYWNATAIPGLETAISQVYAHSWYSDSETDLALGAAAEALGLSVVTGGPSATALVTALSAGSMALEALATDFTVIGGAVAPKLMWARTIGTIAFISVISSTCLQVIVSLAGRRVRSRLLTAISSRITAGVKTNVGDEETELDPVSGMSDTGLDAVTRLQGAVEAGTPTTLAASLLGNPLILIPVALLFVGVISGVHVIVDGTIENQLELANLGSAGRPLALLSSLTYNEATRYATALMGATVRGSSAPYALLSDLALSPLVVSTAPLFNKMAISTTETVRPVLAHVPSAFTKLYDWSQAPPRQLSVISTSYRALSADDAIAKVTALQAKVASGCGALTNATGDASKAAAVSARLSLHSHYGSDGPLAGDDRLPTWTEFTAPSAFVCTLSSDGTDLALPASDQRACAVGVAVDAVYASSLKTSSMLKAVSAAVDGAAEQSRTDSTFSTLTNPFWLGKVLAMFAVLLIPVVVASAVANVSLSHDAVRSVKFCSQSVRLPALTKLMGGIVTSVAVLLVVLGLLDTLAYVKSRAPRTLLGELWGSLARRSAVTEVAALVETLVVTSSGGLTHGAVRSELNDAVERLQEVHSGLLRRSSTLHELRNAEAASYPAQNALLYSTPCIYAYKNESLLEDPICSSTRYNMSIPGMDALVVAFVSTAERLAGAATLDMVRVTEVRAMSDEVTLGTEYSRDIYLNEFKDACNKLQVYALVGGGVGLVTALIVTAARLHPSVRKFIAIERRSRSVLLMTPIDVIQRVPLLRDFLWGLL